MIGPRGADRPCLANHVYDGRDTVAAAPPALSVRELRVSFGALRAVDGVDLDIPAGAVVGLIGPNGAGKTTLVDSVTGFLPAAGYVHLNGRPLAGLAPHQRARAGLGRTWQSLELFADLTVAENMQVAAQTGRRRRGRQRVADADSERVEHALETFDVSHLRERTPAQLSQGQRKLVDLARAVATGAHVLCLDEPAAGLDSSESLALGRRLRHLAKNGLALLLIDHDMGLVLGVCDEVYVLDFGCVIARGTPDQIRRDPAVIAAYLGTSTVATARPADLATAVNAPALSVTVSRPPR